MLQPSLQPSIVVRKNAEIQALTDQVSLAQNNVTQKQAIVDAVQAKSTQFGGFLARATDDKASALTNFNAAKDALASVDHLNKDFSLARNQADLAKTQAENVARHTAQLIGKLIFAVEVIAKTTQLVNKLKATNPQLPDTLVGFMTRATGDANSAIALTLTALQSSYAAESTLQESGGIMRLSAAQAQTLKTSMAEGWKPLPGATATQQADGIVRLLEKVYLDAAARYDDAVTENDSMLRQLSYAQSQLARATMQLSSYQAGLRAATAAAYAA